MNYFEEALKLANNQASVRLMTDSDILAMVESLANGLKAIHEKIEAVEVVEPVEAVEESVNEPAIPSPLIKQENACWNVFSSRRFLLPSLRQIPINCRA